MPGVPEILVNVPAPPGPTATDQGQLGPGVGPPGILIDRNAGAGATGPVVPGPGTVKRGRPTDRLKEQVTPPTLEAAQRELKDEVVSRKRANCWTTPSSSCRGTDRAAPPMKVPTEGHR